MTIASRSGIKSLLVAIVCSAVVTLLVVVAYDCGVFSGQERFWYDLRFRTRGEISPDARIVIVSIDEESEEALGKKIRHWPRTMYAKAVDQLTDAGAAVIAFDVHFTTPAEKSDEDKAFARAIDSAGNVILPRYVAQRVAVDPLPMFDDVIAGLGFINVILDPDAKFRSSPAIMMDVEGNADLFFPIEIVAVYEDVAAELLPDGHLRLGSHMIPPPDLKINFPGGRETYPYVPFWKAVKGTLEKGAVKDKIVLIGNTHRLNKDAYPTPFSTTRRKSVSKKYQGWKSLEEDVTPGIEIHAAAIQTILKDSYVTVMSRGRSIVLLALLGFLPGIFFFEPRVRLWLNCAFLVALSVGAWFAAQELFSSRNLMIPFAAAEGVVLANFITGSIYQIAALKLRNARIRRMFGRYVSPQVLQKIMENPSAISLAEKRRATVLFADIRSFTKMSEQMTPEEVMALLNDYFHAMVPVIFKYDGTVDKFVGDEIMVVFGVPFTHAEGSLAAIRTAVEMQAVLGKFNDARAAKGRVTIQVGIAIHTGDVVAGTVGSEERTEYSVIGDTVNTAARMEGEAGPGQILISEAVHKEVKNTIEAEPLAPISVKGKQEPLQLYAVKAEKEPVKHVEQPE